MRSRLIPGAIAFAIVMVVGLTTFFVWRAYPWVFSGHYTLRIATGPLTEHGTKFLAAFKREVTQEHPRVRLNPIETAGMTASAAALKNGEVDVAVVRGDDPATAEGRAIFVLRKLYAAVLVPAHASVDSIADLKGEKIAVLAKGGEDIDPLAKAVLAFYGFDDRHVLRLSLKDLAASLHGKRFAALLVVGPVGPGALADSVQVFRKVTKKPPSFLDLNEAEAIAERFAIYEKADIPTGAINAVPPVPAEDVTTLATSILLVARATLSNYAAGELTRLLLATKSKVAATLPEAGELAAPSADRDVVLPAHPGTIAFLNGDQPDLLDESLNYIYLASLITGAIGSLAAWGTSLRNRRQLRELQANIERLPKLLGEARITAAENLNATEEELDRLSEWFVEKFVADEITPDSFANASTRMAHIRALIEKRRAALGTAAPGTAAHDHAAA
jgi:TRAP transporter TAXI family solute receptor